MNIGLDLRCLHDNSYSNFTLELVRELITKDTSHTYTIYTNRNISNLGNIKTKVKKVGIQNGSFKEQTTYYKILKKDNNNLMIFFDHNKPLFYKGDYFVFINSLKDVYYQNFDNYIKKYKYLFLLEKNIQNASNIICFDGNTKNELVERFNINETKIHLLQPFFNSTNIFKEDLNLKIDIISKYSLHNPYFIYASGDGIEKNTERLIQVLQRLKNSNNETDIVFLGDKISNNIALRNAIIQYKLQKNVHFLGKIKDVEKNIIYQKSLGVIFPSLYESFPFLLAEGLYSKKHILASNLINIQSILGENASYFSPLSVNSIVEVITDFLKNPKPDRKNDDIIVQYSKESTLSTFLEIINK